MNFKETSEIINNVNSIAIVGHKNPDGDALGSSFGLYFALSKIKDNVDVILKDYSESFSFLPELNKSINRVEKDYDLLIITDCSEVSRANITEEELNKFKYVMKIDHHKINSKLNKGDYIDDTSISTCGIVYELIKFMNIEIDKNMATYLYTGLLTDSGNFNYENTKSKDLRIAADLIDIGIDFAYICQRINNTIEESKLKLIAKSIDKMESYLDGKIRYTYISYKLLKKLNINKEDAEGMSNYLNKIDKSEIAIYVRGLENGEYKVSMRSRGNVDVSKIAIHFNGGGHARAAGYTMKKRLNISKKELKNKVIEEVIKVGEK